MIEYLRERDLGMIEQTQKPNTVAFEYWNKVIETGKNLPTELYSWGEGKRNEFYFGKKKKGKIN